MVTLPWKFEVDKQQLLANILPLFALSSWPSASVHSVATAHEIRACLLDGSMVLCFMVFSLPLHQQQHDFMFQFVALHFTTIWVTLVSTSFGTKICFTLRADICPPRATRMLHMFSQGGLTASLILSFQTCIFSMPCYLCSTVGFIIVLVREGVKKNTLNLWSWSYLAGPHPPSFLRTVIALGFFLTTFLINSVIQVCLEKHFGYVWNNFG